MLNYCLASSQANTWQSLFARWHSVYLLFIMARAHHAWYAGGVCMRDRAGPPSLYKRHLRGADECFCSAKSTRLIFIEARPCRIERRACLAGPAIELSSAGAMPVFNEVAVIVSQCDSEGWQPKNRRNRFIGRGIFVAKVKNQAHSALITHRYQA